MARRSSAVARIDQGALDAPRKLSLIDIADHVAELNRAIDEASPDEVQPLKEALNEFMVTIGAEKLDGIRLCMDLKKLENDGLKGTKTKLDKKIARNNKVIERMRGLLLYAMLKMETDHLEGQTTTVSLCPGVFSLDVFDESKIPDEYFDEIPAQKVLNRERVEADLKLKIEVPGARMKQGDQFIRIT